MARRYLVGLLVGLFPLVAYANPALVSEHAHATFLLIFFVSLALSVSFICSIAEAVLLTMTPSYIDTLRDSNPKLATMLQEVKIDHLGKSISAILTLNTVAHTLGSLGAGAQATVVFGSAWFGVFGAVMTLATLIGTEIIPKTLGTTYWRHLAKPVAYYLKFINFILMPIILSLIHI